MSTTGSLEINADAIVSRSGGFVKRPIPILHRFNSTAISFPNTTGVRIPFDSVLAEASVGETGFVYEVGGRFYNRTSETLVCLVSYSVMYTATPTASRLAWISMNDGPQRYALEGQGGTNFEPGISGSCILRVAPDNFLSVFCFQNSGLALQILTTHGSPWLSICLI
jgi:hypothetical protein